MGHGQWQSNVASTTSTGRLSRRPAITDCTFFSFQPPALARVVMEELDSRPSGVRQEFLESTSPRLCTPATAEVSAAQCRLKPPLKHTHSLEIPDFTNEDQATATFEEAPIDDFMAAISPQLIENVDGAGLDEEIENLPPVASSSARELGELIAVSPLPVAPSPCSTMPYNLQNCSTSASSDPGQRKGRTSRKQQIQDLRETVAGLSQQLDDLKMLSSPSSTTLSYPSSPASCTASQQVAALLSQHQSLWEQVAARQLALRRMAEEENARLRGLVDLQKRDVRNIKRMMRRRNDAELMDEIHHAKRPKLSNNQEICDKLLEGIDQLYADLDKLYKVKNMAGVPCPGRKHQIYPDAADGTPFVEYMDKNQVPFDYQHAQDAVWKFLQGPRLREGHHACSKEFEQSSCTCKSAIGYTNSEQGMTSYVLEQRVARKYVEVKRTVFISRTLAEPTTSKAWPAGLRFSETMSAVVTPGNTLASGQETAVIEILLSVSRYVDGDKATVLKEWPAYVDVAAKGWSRKVSFNSQEIENLLIDESVGRGTG